MSAESFLFSPEAENAVLGAFILWPHETVERIRCLEPWMFGLDNHRTLFRVMQEMYSAGATIDPLTLRNELRGRKLLQNPVDRALMLDLGKDLPWGFDVTAYASIVQEKWRLREVVRIGSVYAGRANDPGGDSAADLLSQLQGEVFDVMQGQAQSDDPAVAAYSQECLARTLDTSVSAMGLSYGDAQLDAFTSGMQRGEVTTVGARSGVGKSALALQAIRETCRAGEGADLFSLEMTRQQVLERLWAMESGVRHRHIRRKWLNAAERQAVIEAAGRIEKWNLRIHDNGDATLQQIAAAARLSARKHGMALLVLDYIQIVNGEGKDDRQRVSAVSRTLTKLAKKEGIHLMMLSQLSKVDAAAYNRRPSIRDLAETRQMENDSHVVILLHRGWDEQTSCIADEGEFIVPKQRSEKTGAIPTRFNENLLRFEDARNERAA